MKERIYKIDEYKKISIRQFEKEIGVSNPYFTNGKDIGTDKLKSILGKFPEISTNWKPKTNACARM